ncbi:biotin transporter BioY [Paracoccus sp. S-4012]|uniref:biotin transporter BioY n=1 Tax=Paracoccus sp. S-4012 TaxID=2665648 RepID=UPI0018A1B8FD|nr:biotin transporter BioY [Paracoccus sp. S-4012]
MTQTTLRAPTGSRAFRTTVAIVGGAALIALASRIQVPMWPVPATMQTFAVLLLALVLGRGLAVSAVTAWLAYGVFGVPVFASGGGIAYLMGPTAGYMAGFLIAAFVVGGLAQRAPIRGVLHAFALALLGSALILATGALWLAGFVGFEQAVAAGVVPFLLGDLLKSVLLALTVPAASRAIAARL